MASLFFVFFPVFRNAPAEALKMARIHGQKLDRRLKTIYTGATIAATKP
jgi:hypothetical protein